MDSAATPTKPKRVRAAKPKVEATPVAEAEEKPLRWKKVKAVAVLSHREAMAAVDARAAATRQRVLEEAIANGYGPMPRTSFRWIGRRTKGLPFSRMMFVSASPGLMGMRGSIVVRHPTKKRILKTLTATDSILETFMPSLPGPLVAAMLGAH